MAPHQLTTLLVFSLFQANRSSPYLHLIDKRCTTHVATSQVLCKVDHEHQRQLIPEKCGSALKWISTTTVAFDMCMREFWILDFFSVNGQMMSYALLIQGDSLYWVWSMVCVELYSQMEATRNYLSCHINSTIPQSLHNIRCT